MSCLFFSKNSAVILLLILFLPKQYYALGHGCLLENDKSSVYISIPEDRTHGSLLTTLPLLGKTGENGFGDIALKLVRGSRFASLNALQKKLMLKKAIDRDSGNSKFEVVVECTPIGKDKQPQVNITTFVTVTDVNDNAPQFAESEFRIQLPEELPIGSAVALDFTAVDKDQEGPNNYITYSLFSDTKKPLLTIPDPHIPQLVVAGRVDFESIQAFVVDIQAMDSGNPPLKSRVKVYVEVVDVDDLNPYFEHQIYTANSLNKKSADIAHEVTLQIRPQPIRARDSDTFHQSVVYSLSGDNSHQFSIEETTGVVWYSGELSLLPSATLVVQAAQVDRPERNASAILLVTNNASSANVPPQLSYFIQLPSNCPKGRQLLHLPNNSTYMLVEEGITGHPFQLSHGRLTVSGVLHQPDYTLRVVNTSQQLITIHIKVYPSLVTGPEFAEDEYVFELDPAEPVVGRVQAHSYAHQLGDESLFYTLLNAKGDYELDADGLLTVKKDKNKSATEMQELVGMVEDVQGRRNFVRILLKTSPTKHQISLLEILCFASVITNLILVTVFCGKKAVFMYHLKRRYSGEEWMGSCPPGVTITSPISTSDRDAFASSYHSNKF